MPVGRNRILKLADLIYRIDPDFIIQLQKKNGISKEIKKIIIKFKIAWDLIKCLLMMC